jgi:hypothetical protein
MMRDKLFHSGQISLKGTSIRLWTLDGQYIHSSTVDVRSNDRLNGRFYDIERRFRQKPKDDDDIKSYRNCGCNLSQLVVFVTSSTPHPNIYVHSSVSQV